jgi:uncharacterized membrane protein
MTYLAFKSLHIAGVVLFLGNIIITGVWKVLADRTAEPKIVAYAQRLVTVTDFIFTAGGVVLILIGAYGMVWTGGLDPVHTTWLLWGQGLFIASGLIWVAILIPIQIAQARMARGFAGGEAIPKRYWRFGRQWAIWGTVATLLPLANLYFMVFKP